VPTPYADYPRIIAHRCGGRLAAENSLAGLEAAARIGCHGVEFDVMLSADGVPVLMHDEIVERTTDGRGRVADLTLAQLQRLNVGGEPVPTLVDALVRCRALGLWANVEIKPSIGQEAVTGAVVGRMLASLWNGCGVISSFSPAALAAARGVAPALAYAMLADILPTDWQQVTQRFGLIGWHLSATAGPTALAAVRDAGLRTACYTVDETDAARRLFAQGVSAIFSDRPDRWSPGEM